MRGSLSAGFTYDVSGDITRTVSENEDHNSQLCLECLNLGEPSSQSPSLTHSIAIPVWRAKHAIGRLPRTLTKASHAKPLGMRLGILAVGSASI